MTTFAELTTTGVSRAVADLVEPADRAALADAYRELVEAGEPFLVLAGGSNTIVADEGFPGRVLRIATRGIEREDDGEAVLLRVDAGESWSGLVDLAVAEGLSGIEALAGIPGSVGAAPVQNIGAYGQELADVLERIELLDAGTGEAIWLDADELGLGYRTSSLKRGEHRGLVLRVELRLQRVGDDAGAPVQYAQLAKALGVELGTRVGVRAQRDAVIALRASKGMVLDPDDPDTRSTGSFFMNPIVRREWAIELPADAPRFDAGVDEEGRELVKLSAAWLIEHAGVPKGFRLPGSGAAISSKHTLAITNRGGATAEEVAQLPVTSSRASRRSSASSSAPRRTSSASRSRPTVSERDPDDSPLAARDARAGGGDARRADARGADGARGADARGAEAVRDARAGGGDARRADARGGDRARGADARGWDARGADARAGMCRAPMERAARTRGAPTMCAARTRTVPTMRAARMRLATSRRGDVRRRSRCPSRSARGKRLRRAGADSADRAGRATSGLSRGIRPRPPASTPAPSSTRSPRAGTRAAAPPRADGSPSARPAHRRRSRNPTPPSPARARERAAALAVGRSARPSSPPRRAPPPWGCSSRRCSPPAPRLSPPPSRDRGARPRPRHPAPAAAPRSPPPPRPNR